MNELAPHMY